MLTYRSLNALGCLRSASASVWPLSTSYTTCRVVSARILFSVCCARMSRAWTSGRPALIIVANWRVNTTTSRVLTPPPNLMLSLNSLGAARTCTTTMRFFRRCAMTSSRVGRSILSLTRSPLSVRAVYWKSGMAHSLRAPLAARRYLGSAGGGLAAGRDRLPVVERRLADHPQKLVRRRRHPEALVLGDLAAHIQLVERIVQRLHPVLLARLHHGRDLLDLLVPNQRPHGGGHDEDLARHHATAALGLLQQRLGDDTLEHERQLGAHLRPAVVRARGCHHPDAAAEGQGPRSRDGVRDPHHDPRRAGADSGPEDRADPVHDAGGQEARDADAERCALPTVCGPRGHQGRVPPGDVDAERVSADDRRGAARRQGADRVRRPVRRRRTQGSGAPLEAPGGSEPCRSSSTPPARSKAISSTTRSTCRLATTSSRTCGRTAWSWCRSARRPKSSSSTSSSAAASRPATSSCSPASSPR